MEKNLAEIEYETLSEILQDYLDKGQTEKALEYCEIVALEGNPYGYAFMGFIYEEGHGSVEIDYKKALYYYETADALGCSMQEDIVRMKEMIHGIEKRIHEQMNNQKNENFLKI